MDEVRAVEVRLWDEPIGVVAPAARNPGFYTFQYRDPFTVRGVDPAPFKMPVAENSRQGFTFLNLAPETFHGLPGMIADALPDHFGNALITEYLQRHGRSADDIGSLDRLCYVGRRAMGALEFRPALEDKDQPTAKSALQMSGLVEEARQALKGNAAKVKDDLIDVGSSAGGARAKAVIGWNRATHEIVSGQFDLPPGYEHWLLKFDVGTDKQLGTTRGFGRIEYAHYRLAIAAGLEMSECHLLEENGRAHFMTKRFDRVGNEKLHLQSLCALEHLDFNQPRAHGYEQYLRAALPLVGADAVRQAWLRCAYNVAFVNCDDHTKNAAFLMDREGQWRLAPAYDMCFAHNPGPSTWTRTHQMRVGGKDWDITREDLLALAAKFDVPKAGEALDQVLDARAQWPKVAAEAGVPKADIARIASFHPELAAA